ncbi:S-layer homology domain-containing protein [Paenibacillus sp. LS1]|uniref:S-layer homology domain-containing protein n=1 Tax=Paenibacillus sp. LS1 TaxID=2992120 RepID=UPI002231C729|nr:S-layer homology domain-containing protein [Paenibacillus sp. LS1]MCW3795755.1 S-layer homology domain-containing protein [Paenibacillus sp. LS1]
MRVIKKLMLSMMAFILVCFTWPVLPIHAAGQMMFEGVPSVEMRPETEGNQLVKPDVAKVVCSDPTTEASSPSCPVIKWGDLTYWIFSDINNDMLFYVAVYNQKGTLINHKVFSGARYIKEIIVDENNGLVILKGQANNTTQVTFEELKEITYTPGVDLNVTDNKVGMNETVNLNVTMRSPIEDLDGDIVFKSSGSTLTQVELANCKAEYSLDSSTLGLGVHTFTADYIPKSGSEFKMNTSKPVTIEVAYRVNFMDGQGNVFSKNIVRDGGLAQEPNPSPTRAGHTFVGWYTDPTDPATQWNFGSNTVAGNVTLYAHWTVNNYTVTYDANYSGAGTATTETVAYGVKASEPSPTPTRVGYTLAGWYIAPTDPTTKWNFGSDVVEGDVTLYAHWTVKITPQPPTPSLPSPSVPSSPSSTPVVTPADGQQSQFTVLINGKEVSARRVDETSANGQPVVRLILTAQGLTDVMNMNTNSSEARIVINGLGTAVKLEIPVQPLQSKVKADAKAKLQITVNGNRISIPLNNLADRKSDSALTVSIMEGSKEAQARVERVAQTMEARVVLKQPITLSIDINGQDAEDGSNDYLHKSILIPAGLNPNQITVVRIDTNGQLHFVPAVFTATQAEILSTQGGDYTIISMNKVFNDVQQHWAGEDIQQMANKLIVDGRPDGSFAPEQPITRAEFTAMLVRAMGLSGGSVKTELPSAFNDVDSEQWYANALITAGSKGLVNGFADGSFHPDGQITREQMATMLDRALNLMKLPNDQLTGAAPSFTDASNISNWSSDAVARLVETGIVMGMNGGTFAPQENATRAQSTVMLMRLMRFAQLIN